MKEIPLTQGYVALVDDEDYELVSQYKWLVIPKSYTNYASRTIKLQDKPTSQAMHRLIMGLEHGDKRQIDHINHNGLDNRRNNLRIVTCQENQFNTKKREGGLSKYKGVALDRYNEKWHANITLNEITISIGRFDNEIDAAKMYDRVALREFGEFACTNFPRENYSESELLSIKDILKHRLERKTSRFRGVYWSPERKKWKTAIDVNRTRISLGSFDDEPEAAKAYNKAAIKYHKEKAKLNNV